MRRLLIVALLIELGLLLIVIPWSAYWERNYFAQMSPLVNALVTNNYVRGGITGLGAVNLLRPSRTGGALAMLVVPPFPT